MAHAEAYDEREWRASPMPASTDSPSMPRKAKAETLLGEFKHLLKNKPKLAELTSFAHHHRLTDTEGEALQCRTSILVCCFLLVALSPFILVILLRCRLHCWAVGHDRVCHPSHARGRHQGQEQVGY